MLLCTPLPSKAQDAPLTAPEESWLYYEIGGARPISRPPNPDVSTMILGAGANFSLGYSCGQFDPVSSVRNQLNDIRQGSEDMMDQMVNAATAAIAALPALILQRANPGLYDLFQNALLRAEERLSLATKSCEQMEAEIAKGKDPFAEWMIISRGQQWKQTLGTGEDDIVRAHRTIEETGGDEGVQWIGGGRRGGIGQPPIHVIQDTVQAGYNTTFNRSANNAAPLNGNLATTPLGRTWPNPTQAREYARDVLGETIARTCNDCERESTPGTGLLPQQEHEFDTVITDLTEFVDGVQPLTQSNLATVSAPSVGVSRQIVESIRRMPSQERALVTERLAAEVATGRTIDKALMLRRMLLTGRQVPEILSYDPARREIDEAIATLDQEIDNVLFETRVRKELVSSTAGSIMRREARERAQSIQIPSFTPAPIRPIPDGVIRERN
ncbi:MAG: integrating conjugative element protein [Dehalococcoidia bacterium]